MLYETWEEGVGLNYAVEEIERKVWLNYTRRHGRWGRKQGRGGWRHGKKG